MVKSRIILPPSVETTSIAAASPPHVPIADVIKPNIPGRFGYSALTVMLYATPGFGPDISVSPVNRPINDDSPIELSGHQLHCELIATIPSLKSCNHGITSDRIHLASALHKRIVVT